MDNTTDSSVNDTQAQTTCLQSIFRSTKGLIDLIEENAADIVADDMADELTLPSFFKSVSKIRFHSWSVFLAGTLFGAFSAFGAFKYASLQKASDQIAENLIQERIAEEQTLTPIADIELPLPPAEQVQETTENETLPVLEPDHLEKFTIKPQQTLSAVLKQGGLTNREMNLVIAALSDILNLKQIQAGSKVEIGKMNTDTEEKALLSVTVEDRRGNRYTAAKTDEDLFEASLAEPEVEIKTEYAEGTISGPFIPNAKAAGIPTNVIHQIIWSFDGPVDFSRDLRKGDKFTAVFQKEYNKEGHPTGNGALLYASINLHSHVHERYLYKDSKNREDYYDETGKIARKLFTMHPLVKPRQTSKFGQRKHPILGYTIMHWGADFGAPIGTPIRAPGEGTITQALRKGSYGYYVQIKHNSEYSTAYGHMSGFHKLTKVGRKVKAGDVIGYVGTTGRSTGPHLHWELIKNGKRIDPVTQRITAQRKLTGDELKRFYAERDRIRDNLSGEIAYAKAEPLPEDRKPAYQEPKPVKKTAQTKTKVKKKATQKTAARYTKPSKG
ncbi:MAG: peptidoglycan DD-metalloendopeptidase family protein [Alphaproteobacteria bacterium]|nr:peptidoglycan DD-metalloendopeptidase family protein [Alphaproteobacteria bacterium]